ncbi:hypothetical protein ACET3X_007560 [Alternaria dauci]|uniref:Extracellular membrane protein CFEM domain-containing protein n=1 Tax=Alternaria dauci TaxID=48095 RepID=A0ABR3UCT4_9PLEO
MLSKVAAIALMLSAATASPTFRARQDDKCVVAYDACVAAGTAEVICSCDRTTCYGEDAARIRECPKLVEGKTWTIANLTRYCIEGNTGCDYNFAVIADGKTERCTVIRMPVSDAATESWANQPCTTGSDLTISWGYVAEPAPAFAVVTVNKGAEVAWFGVSDINGGEVSPSSPFGSGDFGTLPASPVYTYN